MKITRFAPSPTGPLHLGHAYSAQIAHDRAVASNGHFLLRIEDIDPVRSKKHWENQIYDDLSWIGLTWQTPVMRQSDRIGAHQDALAQLDALGLLYPCTCNRADIRAALSAPQEDGHPVGPDGLVYPGTCRPEPSAFGGRPAVLKPDEHGFGASSSASGFKSWNSAADQFLSVETRAPKSEDVAIRLNIQDALTLLPNSIFFQELGPIHEGHHKLNRQALVDQVGDVVLARRGMGTSYHLAVVVDDAAQGVTEVSRGADLFDATPLHVLLGTLLRLPIPRYYHHTLIRDDAGKRLAKRDDARALSTFRELGETPQDVRSRIGLSEPLHAETG